MDPIDLRTLKILEKVDNDGAPSQRDLARDLNISLGLVNSFIKRLVKKGFFKKIKTLIDTAIGMCSNSERSMSERSYASKSYAFFCLECIA